MITPLNYILPAIREFKTNKEVGDEISSIISNSVVVDVAEDFLQAYRTISFSSGIRIQILVGAGMGEFASYGSIMYNGKEETHWKDCMPTREVNWRLKEIIEAYKPIQFYAFS